MARNWSKGFKITEKEAFDASIRAIESLPVQIRTIDGKGRTDEIHAIDRETALQVLQVRRMFDPTIQEV